MRSVGNSKRAYGVFNIIDRDKMPILGSHTINSPTGKDSRLDLFYNGNIACDVWDMFHFLVWYRGMMFFLQRAE